VDQLDLYLLTFLSIVHESMHDYLLCIFLVVATVEFPDAKLFCILHLTYSASGIVLT
jgi:hypothetical protein